MELKKRDIVQKLKDSGKAPGSKDYSTHVQDVVLDFYGMSKENLKNVAKFKQECSKFAFNVKTYYGDWSRIYDKMINDPKRTVGFQITVQPHI